MGPVRVRATETEVLGRGVPESTGPKQRLESEASPEPTGTHEFLRLGRKSSGVSPKLLDGEMCWDGTGMV